MTRRNFAIILISAVAVVALAWLFHTPAPTATPTVAAAKPAPPQIQSPRLAPAQIAPPVAGPAPKPGDTTGETAAAPADGDPQRELGTSIDDIIGLLQSGDLYTAMMRYIPPDKLAEIPPDQMAGIQTQMQAQMAQPEMQMGLQMMVQVLQNMKTMTPTLNGSGDKATYQISDPTGQDSRTQPFSFQKIEGKWYVNPDDMGGM